MLWRNFEFLTLWEMVDFLRHGKVHLWTTVVYQVMLGIVRHQLPPDLESCNYTAIAHRIFSLTLQKCSANLPIKRFFYGYFSILPNNWAIVSTNPVKIWYQQQKNYLETLIHHLINHHRSWCPLRLREGLQISNFLKIFRKTSLGFRRSVKIRKCATLNRLKITSKICTKTSENSSNNVLINRFNDIPSFAFAIAEMYDTEYSRISRNCRSIVGFK